jgi:hypothetical protein
MKESLKKFIASIFSSINIEDRLPFEVYEVETDALSPFANKLEY